MNEPTPLDDELFDEESTDQQNSKPGRQRRSRSKSSKTPTWVIALIIMCGFSFFVCPCLIALLLPAVQSAREAARLTQARNSMKFTGIALHNFHDVHEHFPPISTVDQRNQGEEVQSWITDLLPYLEHAAVYESIHRFEPWNSAGNKQPMTTVLQEFINPSEPSPPLDAQGYAVSHFASNSQVMSDEHHLSMQEIPDGLSHTILTGSVGSGFKPWGDPTNHRDPAAGLGSGPQQFGSPHAKVVLFLMGDGSVRMISKDIAPEVLELLADPADGVEPPPF